MNPNIENVFNQYKASNPTPTGGSSNAGASSGGSDWYTPLKSAQQAPGAAQAPNPGSDFGHPLDALSRQYQGAISTAKQGVAAGAGNMQRGGLGNTLKGAASAGLGAAAGGAQAAFAPFAATANAAVPGNGFMSDVAKGGIVGGEMGSIIPGAGTLAGAGVGALFGGGIHVVNAVKDFIMSHTNMSDEDKAMINNGMNIGLSVLGEKAAGSAGGEEGLNSSVSDVGTNLKNQATSAASSVSGAAKATSDAVSGAASSAKESIGNTASSIKEGIKPTLSPEEAVGQVIQGKTEDVAAAQRALTSMDTSGIKKYSDLQGKINDQIKTLSKAQDNLLGQDTKSYKIQQLATKVGNVEAAHNYVNDALSQLKEYYTKTNDIKSLQKVDGYLSKVDPVKGKGLTLLDVNNIAKMHGIDLNGYNANGELASGLTKQAAENTRMGLKDTVRNLIKDPASKALDAKISDLYDTKTLIDKQVEKVNAAGQKTPKQGAIPKLVGKAVKTANVLTGSPLNAIGKAMGAAGSSGALSPVEIEGLLQKNLGIIRGK